MTHRAVLGFLLAACGQALGDVTFSTVALTGDGAPGLSGVTFKFLSDARVNSAGDVAFWAELGGTGVTTLNESSVWKKSGGALSLVVRESDSVPTLPGMVFAAAPRPAINDSGELALMAVVSPPNETSSPIISGVFLFDALGPHLVAQEGTQAPGLPAGTNYTGFGALSLTPDGRAVWQGNAGAAVWQGSVASPATAVAVRGDSFAGIPDVLDYLDAPGNAPAGGSIFRATTVRGADRGVGIWIAGAPGPVALSGQPIAGTPAGVVYDDLTPGPVACAGDCVAFWAHASGTGVTTANDSALVAGSAGAPAVVMREGDAAPGTGATIAAISPQVMITEGGTAVYQATLAGAGVSPDTNSAIYSVSVGSTPVLVAREGDAAPGLGGSVQFAGFGPLALSPHGALAFVADLRGGGATIGNNRALYVRTTSGQPIMVVRTGSQFDTGSGNRTVEEIVLDADPAQSGLGAVADTAGGALLIFTLHFKDVGPNTVVRSLGLFTALVSAPACYPNCDASTTAPVLNVADFGCFLQKFAAADSYANCDGSTSPPILNVADFSCFLQKFAAGCQ